MQLSELERRALEVLYGETVIRPEDFTAAGKFPLGFGAAKIRKLLKAGLITEGVSIRYHGQKGYRITERGKEALG